MRSADWIKTTNTGGYMSFGDDPAKVTWFEDEMQCLAETARQLGLPCRRAHGCGGGMQTGNARGRSQSGALLPDR